MPSWIKLYAFFLLCLSGLLPLAARPPAPVVDAVVPVEISADGITIRVMGSGFEPGARIWFGGAVLATDFVSEKELRAVGPPSSAPGGFGAVSVHNPASGERSALKIADVRLAGQVPSRAAARFLEQASWGPAPESMLRVQQLGFEPWIEEQFRAKPSDYPDPPAADDQQSLTPAQRRFFVNAIHGEDQLRQRLAFALGQIWVVSATKMSQARQMVPYLRLLHNLAFSNYLSIMREVTLSPTMGRFLDMVNNTRPDPSRGIRANENYAREIMQLFTIGTVKLNPDGTAKLDEKGNPVQTYDQTVIEQLALALTGWTFPAAPGQPDRAQNPAHWEGRMTPWEPNHDYSEKRLMDEFVIPSGQTAAQDLDSALKHLFEHPNMGPFVARRLIGSLVTSNPSPEYIRRVAAAFQSSPAGVRGDLKAVVKAILLDPEARRGDNEDVPATYGHLREPVLYMVSMLRAMGAKAAEENRLPGYSTNMGQNLFFPPTVFNYFSLLYQIPGRDLMGPEYEILTPSTALMRANFADAVAFQRLGPTVTVDLVPWINLAADPEKLVEALNQTFLYGRMSREVRQTILQALAPVTDGALRAQTAFYLVASSTHYQVQQ
ncbi:MAG: DUF1800 domain-containing protein [Acidobacteria bacterium]|nr:DUF1800 domain-containing protein [Acidobacteriota bacterium]